MKFDVKNESKQDRQLSKVRQLLKLRQQQTQPELRPKPKQPLRDSRSETLILILS